MSRRSSEFVAQFEAAPDGFIQGTTIRARRPIVVAADLNGDRRLDLAIFDYGVYVAGDESVGIGNPPQLYLTGEDGLLYRSEGLADAVRRHNREYPNPEYSGPADLHVKAAAAGDIDNDGDVDLWVQSIGGANVSVHVMVNNGDETFTLDVRRQRRRVARHPPEPLPERPQHRRRDRRAWENNGRSEIELAFSADDRGTFEQRDFAASGEIYCGDVTRLRFRGDFDVRPGGLP